MPSSAQRMRHRVPEIPGARWFALTVSVMRCSLGPGRRSSLCPQFESREPAEHEVLRKRGGAIKVAGIAERRFDRSTGAKLAEKAPGLLFDTFDFDTSRAPFDQNVDRTRVEIDVPQRVVIGVENRAPYGVCRIIQSQQSDRRIGNEANTRLVFGLDCAEF